MAGDQCVPLYRQHEYFIFDREDLRRISDTSTINPDFITTSQGFSVDIFMSDPSTHVDMLFWGSFMTLMALVFLLGVCCFYCCIWWLCVNDSSHHRSKQSPFLGLFFGILTVVMTLVNIGIAALLVWYETRLNSESKVYQNRTKLYLRNFVMPGYVPTVERWTELFFTAETYRYWISIIYLGSSMLIVLMTALVTCLCVRIYKAPFLVILLGVITGLAVIGSPVCGTAFLALMYLSIMCYDLSRISGSSYQCSPEGRSSPHVMSLMKFCGEDVFIPLYVVTGLFILLLVGLFLLQCFGTVLVAYIHNLNEERDSNKRNQPNQRPSSPSSRQTAQRENTTQNTAVTRVEHRASITSAPIQSHVEPFHFSNARAWSSNGLPRSFSRMTSAPALTNPSISEEIQMQTVSSLPEDAPPDYDQVMRGDYLRTPTANDTGAESTSCVNDTLIREEEEPNENVRAEFEVVEDSDDSTDSSSTQ